MNSLSATAQNTISSLVVDHDTAAESTVLTSSTAEPLTGPSEKDQLGLVLIVDDTPNNLKVLSETLADAEFEVAIATSGESALEQLNHTPVSLILLDVMMPGIDGFETCRRLKANPDTADIPVIFITALSDATNKVEGFDLGAVDYISKPFERREVIARVRTHLKLNQLSRALEAQNAQLQQLNQQLEDRVEQRTTALAESSAQLKSTQLQVVQNEKMATLGSLVAGIAHEVNNPIGYLRGSIQNAKDYANDLCEYLAVYQQHQPPVPAVQESAEDLDVEFILEDLPKLLNSMSGATDRIKRISTSLRTFSRADTECKVSANLHEGLDSTLMILKYRLKANEHRPVIEVVKDYGDLPEVSCFPGQLNQVFMNVLANAIDMFDEMVDQVSIDELKARPQQITIQTRLLAEHRKIEVRIADNGKGMPEEIRSKIFERSFTTKEVGKGTGLGLAISHNIVVETHEGRFDVETVVGQGSTFVICLPIV